MKTDKLFRQIYKITFLLILSVASVFSTNDDLLSYNTVQIRTPTGSGTGFFLDLIVRDQKFSCLITNKHVKEGSTEGEITFHTKDEQGMPLIQPVNVKISEHWKWIDHPENVDLCAMLLAPIIQNNPSKIGCYLLNEANLITDDELQQLTPVNAIMMLGFPIGLLDPVHNFPIFRQGITATHPGQSYNPVSPYDRKPQFLIDAACWPGSSGSPVFLRAPITTRNGTIFHGGATPMANKLLGVLWGGPIHTAQGTIESREIPMALTPLAQTPIPANLGYVIHAREILKMKQAILDSYNSRFPKN